MEDVPWVPPTAVPPGEPNTEGAAREEPNAAGAGAPNSGADGAGAPNKPVLPAVEVTAEPNPVDEVPKAEVVGAVDDAPNAELPKVDVGVEDTPNPVGAGEPKNPPVEGAGAVEPKSPPVVGAVATPPPNKVVDGAGAIDELPNPPKTGAGVVDEAGLPNKLGVLADDPNAEVPCAVGTDAPNPPKDGAGVEDTPKPKDEVAGAAAGEPNGVEGA